MKKAKFLALLVLSGALLLPACSNATVSSIINELSQYTGQSESQGGESSQNTPASSDNNGGQSSANNPNSSVIGQSSTPVAPSSAQQSSSQGGGQSRYEITAAEWQALFTDFGLFGPNSNVTLNQVIRAGTLILESGVLENNNGDLHILSDSLGEQTFETYFDRLADGGYEMYDLNDDGYWEKIALPASYASYVNASLVAYIPPMEYSSFTYDASSHAYVSAGGTVDMGDGEMVAISDVTVTFEDGKFMSLNYSIQQEGMAGTVSVLASKYGSTFFDFPEAGSHIEIPDDNYFVNSLFRYKELKECVVYSSEITKEQVQGYLCTAELALFEDGEFEMFYKDAAGLRSVILGSYTVPGKASAELVTRSMYSDKSRSYSFEIPALYEEFSLFYNDETENYEMGTFFLNDEGDLLAKITIVFVKTSEQPMHLDLPQEPVNDKWSVSQEVWNKYFGGAFFNRQTNITINHGSNVTAFDNGKIYSKMSYAQYGAADSEIYLKALNDDISKVDYYEYDRTAQIWTLRQNVEYSFMIVMGAELGVKQFSFADATYNSIGHYYSIRSFTEYPYGVEAGYSEVYGDIKIYFENDQLQQITYKTSVGTVETFLYSKAGSTSVTLPEIGPAPILEDMFVQRGFKFDHYSNSNTAFDMANYAGSLAMDEVRFFHDTTDYTFEFLMADRYYDGQKGNQLVFSGTYSVRRASSSALPYQYYLSLNVVNVYCNGMNLSEEGDDSNLFTTFTLYYFETDDQLCLRDDGVFFQTADGQTDITDIRMYYKGQSDAVYHFSLPRIEDNWSPIDVIMAMSQIGVMNDDLPKMDYVKEFSVSRPDTTNKTFDITCQMANQFFVDHIFKPYKASLKNQYRFNAEYNAANEIVAVVSPNAEFKVTFEEKENFVIVFHIQNYIASVPEPEYPTSTIATYLRANNVTDVVPEFKVQGATQYLAYGDNDYMGLNIMIDANLIDNAVTSLIKLLTDAEYTVTSVGEMVVYNSKNNQVSVMISSSKEAGYLFVMLMKPISSSLESAYPSDELASYLTGVTDTVPNYDHADGYQYATFGPNDDILSFNISVYLKEDSEVNVKTLIEGFENDLVENQGYEYLYIYSEIDDIYPQLYYVSANKQVAISFEYSVADKAYNVEFMNLGLFENMQFLREDSPSALSVCNYLYEFEIGDEFTLGDDAYAFVYLMNGTELEISADQLEYKPVTFTEAGEYGIDVYYTVDGVTVMDTVWVYVNEPEAEHDNITLIVTNMNVFEDLINQEVDYSAYVIAKSEAEPDGEWCEVLIDVENNCVIVYDVSSAASEMTFFVEDENGTVLYYASLRMVAGQTEYTVTLVAADGN